MFLPGWKVFQVQATGMVGKVLLDEFPNFSGNGVNLEPGTLRSRWVARPRFAISRVVAEFASQRFALAP